MLAEMRELLASKQAVRWACRIHACRRGHRDHVRKGCIFVEDSILLQRKREEVRGPEMWRVSDGCRFQS